MFATNRGLIGLGLMAVLVESEGEQPCIGQIEQDTTIDGGEYETNMPFSSSLTTIYLAFGTTSLPISLLFWFIWKSDIIQDLMVSEDN